jgi:hypothetical protein
VKEVATDYSVLTALSGKYMERLQPLSVEYVHCYCKLRTPHRFQEWPNIHGMKLIP